jgi:hypothetical protein
MLDAVEAAGATHCAVGFPADSPAHYGEQLEALEQLVELSR